MKQGELNTLAHCLCGYLCSRNNDIKGYWGIGVLCTLVQKQPRPYLRFQMHPGELLSIGGIEITGSRKITDNFLAFGLSSITGKLEFAETSLFPCGAQRYFCTVAVAVTHGGRTGLDIAYTECWPHNASRESRRWTAPTP